MMSMTTDKKAYVEQHAPPVDWNIIGPRFEVLTVLSDETPIRVEHVVTALARAGVAPVFIQLTLRELCEMLEVEA